MPKPCRSPSPASGTWLAGRVTHDRYEIKLREEKVANTLLVLLEETKTDVDARKINRRYFFGWCAEGIPGRYLVLAGEKAVRLMSFAEARARWK
jgi:hypothetical protein